MDERNMFFECEPKITKRISHKVEAKIDVEDLRQEVFIRYVNGLKGIKNTDNLCGYLLRITDNVVNDFYRNKSKISSDHFNHFEPFESSKDATIEEYALSNISLMSFIDKLPEKYKEALMLTEIEGESQKQVAEKLNLSYSALKSRVQRAREMLKTDILNCCDYQFDRYGNIISCCESKPCC
jgi:RNA polymerase sigma-70 factor, ECF subfamily